jgi:anti-sigma-K factor RskA
MTDKRKTQDDATLTGAYVLNSLTPDESEAFEARLAESEALRHEVTELADTAVLLGFAVDPVQPPAALKANIMGLISSMPQLPANDAPVRDAAAGSATADSEPTVTESAGARVTPIGTAAFGAAPVITDVPNSPAQRKAERRWYSRPIVALAGAAAAVALVAGGVGIVGTITDSQRQSVMADGLAAINAADDSQQAVAAISGGGTATMVWSNELASSAVIVDDLPTLPDGKVYELWYIDTASVARPAGTFTVDSDGKSWRVLDGEMHAGDTVGVTVEPAGGSEKPTTEPIVAIASA